MSTLQVSNIHFETTANNRIQYTGSNSYNFVVASNIVATLNTSGMHMYSTTLKFGNSTVNATINSTALYFNGAPMESGTSELKTFFLTG